MKQVSLEKATNTKATSKSNIKILQETKEETAITIIDLNLAFGILKDQNMEEKSMTDDDGK